MADMHINKNGWLSKWTKEEDNVIKLNYPKNGWEKVHELLPSRDKASIQRRASKLNVRYLQYDKDYFEVINTIDKAYWLGFLYADGYVTTNDRWGLELQLSDINHMKKLLYDFNCNINIKERNRNGIDSCGFQIKNKKMYCDLVNCGIVQNKTYILKFPNENVLNKNYINHFIRGFFDGDGCIYFERYLRTKNNWKTSFYSTRNEVSIVCKSEDFLDSIIIILKNNGIETIKTYNPKDNLPTLRIQNYKNILKFYNYIYNDSNEKNRLDRKYDKFNKLIATINQ